MDTDSTSVWKRKSLNLPLDNGLCGSVKSSQVVQSPTTAVPKLLQMQRPTSMSADTTSTSKENGLASPRRSFDSSSGSTRSDSSSLHPLKYTWVSNLLEINLIYYCRHSGACTVNLAKVQEMPVITLQQTRKSPLSHPYLLLFLTQMINEHRSKISGEFIPI